MHVVKNIPQQLVATLTDRQMEDIAAKMGDYYSDQGYWDHLATAVEHITGTSTIGPEEESVEAFSQGLGNTI